MVRQALLGPLDGGREQGLLDGVLGGVEVAVPAGEQADDPRREFAQQVVDGRAGQGQSSAGGAAITWRTSIAMFSGSPPGPGAEEACAAISIARCSVSQSTIQ